MKSFMLIAAILLPALAKADLQCQGFNPSGHALPVTALIEFLPSRTAAKEEPGLRVGTWFAITSIFSHGKLVTSDNAFVVEKTVTTRCKVGSTITLSGETLKMDLYAYDACSASPVNTLPVAYKGTLTKIVSGQPKSLYVACNYKK
jgi:hypothetical protein